MRSGGSLKARLAGLTALVVGVVWLAAAGFTWFEARHEAEEVFDAHLVQAASLLIAQTALELEDEEELEDSHAPTLHKYARQVAFQVWSKGRLQVHSPNAPATPLSDVEAGFSERPVGGEAWRVFSAWNDRQKVLVQVGERLSAREALAREIAAGLLKPLMLALPLLAVLIWVAVGRAVAPLEAAARELAERSPGRLDPLPADGLPAEARPLVDRLNALFVRVAQSIESERRFTADAAHELRTPLAALRAQAQVAAAAGEDAVRRRALDAVLEGCDRMTRLIGQLLVLARIDAMLPTTLPAIDLARLAQETLAGIAAQAVARRVEIELAAPGALSVRGNADWLAILLRNLVDNAVRHSPPGGRVRVVLAAPADGGAELTVSDEGPGVPEAERANLGRRFHRVLAPTPEGEPPGSGLGLSIVGRIAELHGGRVSYESAEGGSGLRVRVRLPA